MTTLAEPPAGPALDVRMFLLGDDGPAALRERLQDAVERCSADRAGVTGLLRRVAGDQLAEVAAGFLDVDLGATAVAGWRRHNQLREAAHRTAAAPGSRSVVQLARHRTSTTWRPRVDVVHGGATLAHLAFELVVTFEVAGLCAVVSDGRLTALSGGDGHLEVVFSCGGQPLAARKAPFDPDLHVRLGPGVPLLHGAEPGSTPAVVPTGADQEEAPGPDRGRTVGAERAAGPGG